MVYSIQNMRQIQITLLLFIGFLNANSQSFTPHWALNIGNYGLGKITAVSAISDSDGHLHVFGTGSGETDLNLGTDLDIQYTGSLSGGTVAVITTYDSVGTYIDHFAIGLNGGITQAIDMQLTPDGGFVVLGQFRDSTDFDPGVMVYGSGSTFLTYLAKYDANFNLVWTNTFNASTSLTAAKVAVDANGNIAFGGKYMGTLDLDPGPGVASISNTYTDVFWAKYDANGNLLWHKTATNTGTSDTFGDLEFDSDGNLIVAAKYQNAVTIDGTAYFNASYENFGCVTKFDPDGTLIWNKGIGNSNSSTYITFPSIAIDSDNNIILTGTFEGQQNFETGTIFLSNSSIANGSFYLAKLGSNGTFVWAKGLNVPTSEGHSLSIGSDGNLYVSGLITGAADMDFSTGTAILTPSPSTAENYFLASYTTDGNYNWANAVATTGDGVVTTDPESRPWLIGTFSATTDFDPGPGTTSISVPTSTSFLTRWSTNGSFLYASAFRGTGTSGEYVYGSSITDNDKLVIAGVFKGDIDLDHTLGSYAITSTSDSATFIAQYDLNGAIEWASVLTGKISVRAIETDASGNIYMTGSVIGTVDFDPSSALGFASGSTSDFFIAKYSASGIYQWHKRIGNSGFEEALDLKLDSDGNIVVCGRFQATVDFDPSANTFEITNAQNAIRPFIARYDSDGNFITAWRYYADTASKIAIGADNGVAVVGYFEGTRNFNPNGSSLISAAGGGADKDYYVARYSSAGNFGWAIPLGGTSADTRSIDVATDTEGNVFVMAYLEYSSLGTTLDVDPSANTSLLSLQNSILVKYSQSGSLQWGINVGSAGISSFHNRMNLTTDQNGNVIYASLFYGTDDIDPSVSGIHMVSTTNQGLLITRFAPSGAFLNADLFEATTSIRPTDVQVKNDLVAVVGHFQGNTWFNLPPTNEVFLSPNSINGFVLFGEQSAHVENPVSAADNVSLEFAIYPNPSTGLIQIPSGMGVASIDLFDTTGKRVGSHQLTTNSTVVDISYLSSGHYFVRFELNDGDVRTGRLVKQ